jgi:4-hydroxy-tetrahydrodipicolinate synthase
MFRGTGTAAVTPFRNGSVDFEAFGKFLNWQIDSGVEFLVILGTTGEAATMTADERREVISFAVRTANKRVPVVIGTGSNSTAATIELSKAAFALGADGVLVVTPYYNKPTQEGLFRHYKAVAESISGPLVIYNVPGRTGVNMLPEAVIRCAAIRNVVGVKEASGNMAQIDELIRGVRKVRPDFAVLSGNDDQAFHLVCSGGDGLISVLSNVMPKETSDMVRLALDGRMKDACDLHMRLFPLMKNLFIETNPIPVKYAVSRLGFCANELRLPLVEATAKCMSVIDANMAECGARA